MQRDATLEVPVMSAMSQRIPRTHVEAVEVLRRRKCEALLHIKESERLPLALGSKPARLI
jgi:hypothetical protein